MLVQSALTRDDLFSFCGVLADASSAIIRQHFRSGYAVASKQDNSPVTIADRQAEQTMRDLIMQRFPDHGILGEEFGLHQPEAEYRWVLDPIDGTKNFIAHSYLFGTLIALLKQGRPILGVINHPISNDFLIGDGRAAWLNGSPVHVRPCTAIENAVMMTTDHWLPWQHQNGPAFERLTRRVRQYNTWGDCHGYLLVAVGGVDLMLDSIMSTWDLMALAPIIEGAGGRITDWQGNDVVTGASSVASAGSIHDAVIAALNEKE